MPPKKRPEKNPDFEQFTLFDEARKTDQEKYDALVKRLYAEPLNVTNQLPLETRLRHARAH